VSTPTSTEMEKALMIPAEKDLRARQRRWRKRYPTVTAWSEAHPNEAVAQVTLPTSVLYYKGMRPYTGEEMRLEVHFGFRIRDGDEPATRQEFLEFWGKRPIKRDRSRKLPIYPPKPEVWPKQSDRSRASVIKQIRRLMQKHNLTPKDLQV
jgi:hypothetical protein